MEICTVEITTGMIMVEIGHNETGTEQKVQVVAVGGIVRGRGPVVSVVTDIVLYPIVAKLNRREPTPD